MQHMRESVAAGAVNQVRSRTIDLLPLVISTAETRPNEDANRSEHNAGEAAPSVRLRPRDANVLFP
jgi:hypothetical protein